MREALPLKFAHHETPCSRSSNLKATLSPVDYIDRTTQYYAAQGFEKPYLWAHNETAPFAALDRPLSEMTLGLASTAASYRRRELEPRRVVPLSNDRLPDRLYADDLAWDKQATHLDDRRSFFPIEVLHQLASDEIIGGVGPRSFLLPTEYSQRKTNTEDGPILLEHCREDGIDAMLLVPL